MSDYVGIQGQAVINTGSDPIQNNLGVNGQVWYNNTTYAFKISNEIALGAWATGGNLGSSRYKLAGAGTQTAGLVFGGLETVGQTIQNLTEEYDGSTWTAGGNMGTATDWLAGCGTQTSALEFGGETALFVPPSTLTVTSITQEYNGSTWSPGGSLGTARRALGGAGTQTAGLAFGGTASIPVLNSISTEEYDGSAWTAGGNLTTGRNSFGSCGTQTAGLCVGGVILSTIGSGSLSTATEEYDGSTWTAGGTLPNSNIGYNGTSFGIQTAAITVGGSASPPPTAASYDGSTWTAISQPIEVYQNQAGAGTKSAGLIAGGQGTNTPTNNTFEFNSPGFTIGTLTTT
jgi:hypothetical protein